MTDSLDGLFRDLEKKIEAAKKEIDGSISIETLFNTEFMGKYTKLANISELFEKAGLENINQEQFNNLNPELIDSIVKQFTSFSTWKEMKQKAVNQHSIKILAKYGIPAQEQ